MDTLKNICFGVVLFIIVTVILYAVFSFIALEADPVKWSAEGRAFFAIIDIVITLILTTIVFTNCDQ